MKQWKLNNKEHIKNYSKNYFKEYRKTNIFKEKNRIRQEKWLNSEKGKEYRRKVAREWYYSHREECLKRWKKYRNSHKDLIHKKNLENRKYFIEYRRKWKLGNPERYKEYYREYVKKNRDWLNFKNKCYGSQRRGGRKNPEILKVVQMVYEDNIKEYGTLTCYLCLESIPFGKDEVEHKIPISRGGSNEYENLEIACERCNCSKNNKTVEEFLLMRE
jgi:5-methylcytosine-specific restriction endonuclease McrA